MKPAMTTALSAAPATDALLGVYRRPPMEIVRGAGVELFDADGKAYLDFVAGIAVNALGYGDEGLERAMREAIEGSLVHVSNLYRTAPGERLTEMEGMREAGALGFTSTPCATRYCRTASARDCDSALL